MEDNGRNERREDRERHELANQEANELRADSKRRHNGSTRKINKLWLWLGVLVLIFILLWWLWAIGTFEDITGVTNG